MPQEVYEEPIIPVFIDRDKEIQAYYSCIDALTGSDPYPQSGFQQPYPSSYSGQSYPPYTMPNQPYGQPQSNPNVPNQTYSQLPNQSYTPQPMNPNMPYQQPLGYNPSQQSNYPLPQNPYPQPNPYPYSNCPNAAPANYHGDYQQPYPQPSVPNYGNTYHPNQQWQGSYQPQPVWNHQSNTSQPYPAAQPSTTNSTYPPPKYFGWNDVLFSDATSYHGTSNLPHPQTNYGRTIVEETVHASKASRKFEENPYYQNTSIGWKF